MTKPSLLELATTLRETGNVLADELSVLQHTAGLSARCRKALNDWDELSFKLRAALRATEHPHD